jgi:hypothetical protein
MSLVLPQQITGVATGRGDKCRRAVGEDLEGDHNGLATLQSGDRVRLGVQLRCWIREWDVTRQSLETDARESGL